MNAKFDLHWDKDTDISWSDKHIIHCFNWLMYNELSPWKAAPTMLLTAMNVPEGFRRNFRKGAKEGELFVRLATRIAITKALKKIVSGEIVPRIDKRNSLGWVRKYTLLPAANPVPLPMPQFLIGSVTLTRKGLKISMQTSEAFLQAKQDKSKLLNPFGV